MLFENQLKCRCLIHSFEDAEFEYSKRSILPKESKFFLSESRSQYAPDRLIDTEHLFLEIEVDLKAKKLWGKCRQDFTVIAPVVATLRFDAVDLKVSKVLDSSGKELKFEQLEKEILVTLSSTLKAGTKSNITFEYSVVEPRAGLYFITPTEDYPKRPWQLWTQGQDQDNRFWIPCHDAPNEKATSEMKITVDSKFTAISNGKLMGEETKGSKKTYHWKQAIPHASYLITLCIGEFVEMKDSWTNSSGEVIPVQYFTLAGREEETKVSFEKTPKMMSFFSKKIGIDYPYEKYAQVVAYDFIYGGMENTSSTTQTEYTLHPREIDEDFSSEPLVAHELAHQWFGDLLTCKEWSHGWLNEGFATYFESLWTEEEHGKDEFLYEVYLNEKIYKAEDSGHYRRPIVTNVYLSPSDIFDRHLYEKGGRVLHMLRKLVGEEQWWKAIQHYAKANHSKTVETVDLQRSFEAVTGMALAWFFDQWVFKAGHPEIKGSSTYTEESKLLLINLSQTQKKTDLTGLFRLPMELKVVTARGEEKHCFVMDKMQQSFSFECAEKPLFVSLNPENTLLGSWDFDPGKEAVIAQLEKDTDSMGRVYAAKRLAKDHSRASVEALSMALSKEKFWGVQAEICATLGQIGSELCQTALLEYGIKLKHPKARRAAVQALGGFKKEKLIEMFKDLLQKDPSPLVKFEAALSIGKTKSQKGFKILSENLYKIKSFRDSADRGILQGLAEYSYLPEVGEVIRGALLPGKPIFLRRDAVVALAKFGAANPESILGTLMDCVKDSNFFVKISAIDSLEMLGDARATGVLKYISDISVEPRTKRSALTASKTLLEGKTSAEEVGKLKSALDKVSDQYKELLTRMEKIEKK